MTESADNEDMPTLSPPLTLAREYWANARRIGEPGSPSMLEAGDLQARHADMAQTAALLSIAESLHALARDAPGNRRRLANLANSADTLAKELTKIRYIARRA